MAQSVDGLGPWLRAAYRLRAQKAVTAFDRRGDVHGRRCQRCEAKDLRQEFDGHALGGARLACPGQLRALFAQVLGVRVRPAGPRAFGRLDIESGVGCAQAGNETIQLALDFGHIPVVPPPKARLDPWQYDRAMYERHNEVERSFGRIEGYRRIFSRFEKLGASKRCRMAAEAWELPMGSDERAIRELHASWIDAVNAGDLVRLLAVMADDVVFMNPGQAPVGRDGFPAGFTAAHQQARIRCDSEIVEVVIVGDLAYTRCRDSLSVTPRAGGRSAQLAGERITIYRRRPDGGWRLARDANTLSVLPNREPSMNTTTFAAFEADALAAGFDEVLERRWAPDTVLDAHTHAFGVEAVVTQGEMWLSCEGSTRHLLPGDAFTLAPEVPHAERYGPEGATYWVARRNQR